MDLSIIIPSFNTNKLLDRCIASVLSSLKTAPVTYEIIVVDNASTDQTRGLLREKYKNVLTILNDSNVGYGKANNQAIRKAKGTYILLLNSDIVAQKNAIESLVEFGIKHPRSFVGGKLFNEDLSPQASCGPFFSLPVVFSMLFLKGDKLGLTRSSPERIKYVDWVSGACLGGYKTAFREVGLFDEDIFMYMEEVEFLYRAKKIGYRTQFYPQAHFIHTGAASSATNKTPVVNIYKGLLYFYRKHRSIIEQRSLHVLLTVKAVLAIAYGMLTGKDVLVTTYEQALHVDS